MENNILQLIKIITALYFNDKAEDDNPNIYDEIQNILKNIKVDPRVLSSLGNDDAVIESLRYTAEWMIYSKCNFNRLDLLQRLSVNLQSDNDYIAIAKSYLDPEITSIDARKRANGIMQELRYEEKRNKLKAAIAKANAQLNFGSDYIEITPYINNLMTELGELHSSTNNETQGLLGKVNFTDDEDIENALTKGISLVDETGVLNTGFIGLNKACGGSGIPRGFLVNFGALTHCYKSGILIDLCLNIPVYNDPWMWDDTKKPMIMRISFENTIEQDVIILYKKLYEIKYKKRWAAGDVNIADAKNELKAHFQQRGYTFEMLHYDTANFCIYDLFDVLNKYIDYGFEIHAVMCDYLSQIAHHTFGDRLDSKIQRTSDMTRLFCYPKGITFITAHQLSTAAQEESKKNSVNFTKLVCTGGWYMDCKSLHTKLDLEFVMHIHKHIDGNDYLMFSRGKHRGGENTPQSHRHFIYQFQDLGGIMPDYGSEPMVLYSLPKVMDTNIEINWDA